MPKTRSVPYGTSGLRVAKWGPRDSVKRVIYKHLLLGYKFNKPV